jgi:putative ABC transport system permease protein
MPQWLPRCRRLSEEEFTAEVEAHLAHETDEQVEHGLSPEEARYAALRRFGNVTRHLERFREASPWFWLETLWLDVRYGARILVRNRSFTAVALASLALGIGLNTAVFSVVEAVFFQPLPYPDPDRLVSVAHTHPEYPRPIGVSAANYFDWRQQNHVFERMAAYEPREGGVLSGGPGVERVMALHVSADYFPVLGVRPALGRWFGAADDQPGATTVIISDALWRRRWHADPRMVGHTITLDGTQHTVIGVMPPAFRVYDEWGIPAPNHTYDVWLPYPFASHVPANRFFDRLWVIARLKHGISVEQAQSEMVVIGRRLARQYPVENKDRGVWVRRLSDQLSQFSWDVLRRVCVVVAIVLLLVCTNVAALLLARAAARTREMGVRASLGASRHRILRQVLTETTLLTLSGAALGVLITGWARSLLPYALPDAEQIARLSEARVNATTLAFTVALALCTGVVCGLAAAVATSRPDLPRMLNDGGRSGVSVARTRFLNALLVCQLSLSLLLLSGAGLMLRSIWGLTDRPLGFDAADLLTLNVGLPSAPPYVRDAGIQQFPESGAAFRRRLVPTAAGINFSQRVVDEVRTLPGVSAATVALGMPMLRTNGAPFRTDAQPPSADVDWNQTAWVCPVSSDYFRTLDTPVLEGRAVSEHDRAGGPFVAVVNRALAVKYWPSGAAVGKYLTVTVFTGPRPAQRTYEVVGVVGDVRAWPIMDTDFAIYTALAQDLQLDGDLPADGWGLNYLFAVKLATTDRAMIRAITAAIHRVDPAVSIENVRFMRDVLGQPFAFGPWRVLMWVLVGMGAVSLLLACIGIYGVMSYSITQRTHELGVRVALGARPADILRPLLAKGVALACSGIALGAVPAFWFNRLLNNRLYGVSPGDPLTMTVVGLILIAVTLGGVWWPARRAASTDPLIALRSE